MKIRLGKTKGSFMRLTISLSESTYAAVKDRADKRGDSMSKAVNVLVEKGLESLKRDGAEAESNDAVMARLDEVLNAIERVSESGVAVRDAARSIGKAEAAAGRAAASAKLAAQSSYAALLASTVDVINLASIGNDERLVYYQFRDRDLASVSRFFMEAGRAASDNERARTKVWPSFKGAAKASGDPGLDPAHLFFEDRGKQAAAAMDPASDFCDGAYHVKSGREGGGE